MLNTHKFTKKSNQQDDILEQLIKHSPMLNEWYIKSITYLVYWHDWNANLNFMLHTRLAINNPQTTATHLLLSGIALSRVHGLIHMLTRMCKLPTNVIPGKSPLKHFVKPVIPCGELHTISPTALRTSHNTCTTCVQPVLAGPIHWHDLQTLRVGVRQKNPTTPNRGGFCRHKQRPLSTNLRNVGSDFVSLF